MRPYSPHLTLISLHIPKCAGQSFRKVLEEFFPSRIFFHYFQQRNSLPQKNPLTPNTCIHGHFNKTKGFGVDDYYPEAEQFITVLRDPLEAAISNYFYWKTKARANQLKKGIITAGSEDDYKDISDFFRKRPRSNLLDFMPGELTLENYKEIIQSRFVWIGLVENFQPGIDELAHILSVPPVSIGRLNTSTRDEELPREIEEEFIRQNALEFEIYNYINHFYLNNSINQESS